MKRSEVFPSKWLAAADLPEGDTVATIREVTMEVLKNQKTQRDEEKPCIHFEDEDLKPMIVNTTNWKQIEKATGCDDSDDWAGKKIILFATEVEAFGEMKEAIRVRSHAPTRRPLPVGKAAPQRPASRPVQPTSEIEAANASSEEQPPY